MTPITIETTINKKVEDVWNAWTLPEHITHWAFASDTWECPFAENNLVTGGTFKTTMKAKDGSEGFDFTGTYTDIELYKRISYTMDGEDSRKVTVIFESNGESTKIIETFDPETINSEELQRAGWQSILDNFKKYTESI